MIKSILSELRLTKSMLTLELTGNANERANFASLMVVNLLRKQLLQNNLILRQQALTWRNILLRQVRFYIDNNLNPAKVMRWIHSNTALLSQEVSKKF